MKRVLNTDEDSNKKTAMSEDLYINTIRTLSADVVQKANSGHPGAPMGMAAIAHVLWGKHIKLNPKNPHWINRDRFILSNGHASALLYTLLHLAGFEFWTLDVLKTFRQVGSPAAGHPENHFPGIEVTTGPLGQGLSNAVGIAIGEAHMAGKYNKPGFTLFDHYTYVFCGDGCLQEGVTSEASSLAGHLGLGKIILFYDDNHITIDGETELSFSEDVLARYASYGWHTQHVADGNTDLAGIEKALEAAKAVKDKPSIIKVTTKIGYGSAKAGTEAVHGNPLGDADIANVKKLFGFDPEKKFHVPEEAKKFYDLNAKGQQYEAAWNKVLEDYEKQFPELAKDLKRRVEGKLPDGWDQNLPVFKPTDPASATRKSSGDILNVFADRIPDLIGGSADLNPSCFTYLKKEKDFQKEHDTHHNRNLRFGVREHGMAAIMNGLAAYGTFIPFCSTFLNFIGYAYGAVVLSSLSHAQALYIFTHDSIFLGEDGPTHQPIEKYMLCRATPNMNFFRPADANEVVAAYVAAIRSRKTPTVMSLTRQNLPQLEGTSVEGAVKGGYVVSDCDGKPDLVLVATGSEVSLCINAKSKIGAKVRVVSLPAWNLFDAQPAEYKKSIFPAGVPVLSVEAGTTHGWSRYAHASIGIDTFGASGTIAALAKHFGFTVENVAEKAAKTIEFYKGKHVESHLDKPF